MYDEPDIAKELKKAEKLGKLQGNVNAYNELETIDDIPEEIFDGKKFFSDVETGVNKIESTLDINPDKYAILAEKTSDIVSLASFTLYPKFIYVNPSHKKVLGYESDELIGKPCLDFIHPEDKNKLIPVLKRYLGMKLRFAKDKSEYTAKLEFRIKDKSGNWHYLETTANTVGNEVLFVSKDVTERKKAEEELKESEEKFRDLFENANDLIQSADANGRFIYVNKKWLSTLGYTEDEVKDLTITDILRKDQIPHCMEIIKEVYNGKSFDKVETVFVSKDGREIYVEGSANAKFKDGKFIATRGIFRDITAHKKAEEMMKQKEEYFRSLVENSSDVITVMDSNGIVQYQSPNYRNIWGRDPTDELGKDLYKDVHPDDISKVSKEFKRLLEAPGNHIHLRVRAQHEDKSWRVLDVKAHNLLDNPSVGGIVVNFYDITKQTRAEEEIRYLKDYNENILESNPNPIIVIKGKKIEYVNKSFISIFGETKNKYITRNLNDALPSEIFSIFENLLQDYCVSKELKYKRKDFSVYSFVIKKSTVAEEEVEEEKRLGIILQDIGERKKAEEKLKEKIDELERFKKHTVNREIKMIDLKKKITELEEKLIKR